MSDTRLMVCPHCQATNRIPAEKMNDHPRCGKCKKALFTGHPVSLDDRGFNKHLGSDGIPLVVDFWAPWCGPCKMMAPHFESLAAQIEPRARLVKVNTEEAQQTAARFNIRSIPTVAIFKNGREVARQAGAMDARTLSNWIQSHI